MDYKKYVGIIFFTLFTACTGYQSQFLQQAPITFDKVTLASSNAFEKYNGCYELLSPRENNYQYSVVIDSNANTCGDSLGESQIRVKKFLNQKEVQTTTLSIPIFQKGQFSKNKTVLKYDYFGTQNPKCISIGAVNYIQQVLIVEQTSDQIFTSYKVGYCEKTYNQADCADLQGNSAQFNFRKSTDCGIK